MRKTRDNQEYIHAVREDEAREPCQANKQQEEEDTYRQSQQEREKFQACAHSLTDRKGAKKTSSPKTETAYAQSCMRGTSLKTRLEN